MDLTTEHKDFIIGSFSIYYNILHRFQMKYILKSLTNTLKKNVKNLKRLISYTVLHSKLINISVYSLL